MLKPKKRWRIPSIDENISDSLPNNYLHPLVAKILSLRGFKTKEEVDQFLHIHSKNLHDPFLLDGMKKAVDRIHLALMKKEPILIYGDYDADGVTSTSLLYKTFKKLDAHFDYYIPNRFTEGYGLNQEAILLAKENGFKVIVTVDTGISAVKEAELAKELNIDLIITDHHEPPEVLPDAFAIINPKKPNDTYPFKYLAGVGVAFKLSHALLNRVPIDLIDLAAIGTVADLVPLTGENRIIVYEGLRQLQMTNHIGVKALMETIGLADKELTAGHIGFGIGPRINAGGRLDSAKHAVSLLIEESYEQAIELARGLDSLNKERQILVEEMTKEAFEIIEKDGFIDDKVLVIAGEGWNAGVIGIVASRIVERFYRPTIVLSIDQETKMAKGSARSIEGYDIYQALTTVNDLLPHYGGHPAAAGLSIDPSNIPLLREKLKELADQWLTEEDFVPVEKMDAICSYDEINVDLIEQLKLLEPFGIGNPTPKFLIEKGEIVEVATVGKNAHLKLKLQTEHKEIEAIGFKLGEMKEQIATHSLVNLSGELSINEWNGIRKAQIIIKDLHVPEIQIFDWRHSKLSSEDLKDGSLFNLSNTLLLYNNHHRDESNLDRIDDVKNLVLMDLPNSLKEIQQILVRLKNLERIYCVYGNNDIERQNNLPSRETMAQVYTLLKKHPTLRNKPKAEQYFKNFKINSEILKLILDVFVELDFIIVSGDQIHLTPNPKKRELTTSTIYQQHLEAEELKRIFLYSDPKKLKDWFLKQRELTNI